MNDEYTPSPIVRSGLFFGTIGAFIAAAFVPGYRLAAAVGIGIVVAVFLAAYFLWRWWARRKQQKRSDELFARVAEPIPQSVDPAGRATLDDLRRKFQDGINAYKRSGKDLYRLPWYAILGESRAGKTEAIRHCGVSFPPHLHEGESDAGYMGVGGTVSMNWWFTNEAVILDTAGKMVLEGVKPGDPGLFKEFLSLLKRYRPHCPINGLILALPVDSLIKDSEREIATKAAVLARHLDLIQRTLDVRFPVFVVVTKSDLLTGFREFFESTDDIEGTQQMLGWSNPEPLDAAFRPELVDEFLDDVATRLRRRRTAISPDPVVVGPGHSRRLEAVDALFAFPRSLMLVAPRLRLYLKTIFVAGEWAPKPVFLRGIYFTSSLREGQPLDEALASALNRSVDEFRSDRDWERDKTYFLFDLFNKKVFQEKGLVTRASNTVAMLRQRQWLLFGGGAVALSLFVGYAYYGKYCLDRDIGESAKLWRLGAQHWTPEHYWNPVVIREPGAVRYVGDQPVPGDSAKRTLADVHLRLSDDAANARIRVPVIFWPIRLFVQSLDKRPRQQHLFDLSVLWPLLDLTRSNMLASPLQPEADEQRAKAHVDALTTLIRLEVDRIRSADSIDSTDAARYVVPLVNYLTATNQFLSTDPINAAFAATYGQRRWNPDKFSGGASLGANQPINRGLDTFLATVNANLRKNFITDRLRLLEDVYGQARAFNNAESNVFRAIFSNAYPSDGSMADLLAGRTNLDRALSAARDSGWFVFWQNQAAFSLMTNYSHLMKATSGEANKPLLAFQELFTPPRATNGPGLLKRGTQAGANLLGRFGNWTNAVERFLENPLLAGIKTKTESNTSKLLTPIEDSRRQKPDLGSLDTNVLGTQTLEAFYTQRSVLYHRAYTLRFQVWPPEALLGGGWSAIKILSSNAHEVVKDARGYAGPLTNEVVQSCERMAAQSVKLATEQNVGAYTNYVLRLFEQLSERSTNQTDSSLLKDAHQKIFFKIAQDIGTAALQNLDSAQRERLLTLTQPLNSAEAELIQRYIDSSQARLSDIMGFPVVWDDENVVSASQLTALRGRVNALLVELTELSSLQGFPPGEIQRFRTRLNAILQVVNAFVGERGAATYSLKVLAKDQPANGALGPNAKVTSIANYAALSLNGQAARPSAISGTIAVLGSAIPLDIALDLKFQAYGRGLPLNIAETSFPAGIFEFILKNRDARQPGPLVEGRSWLVSVPVKVYEKSLKITVEGDVVIRVEFEADSLPPFPPRDQWPVKSKLR